MAAAAADQLQQATTGVEVLLEGLEVLRQELDTPGQQGNLHLRRPGVGRMGAKFVDDRWFLCVKVTHMFSTILPWRGDIGTLAGTDSSRNS